MNTKKWIKSVLLITTISITSIISFNYIINPYGVFSNNTYQGINKVKDNIINDEVTKFYNAKKESPDVLLIGTSRVEHINPKHLKKYKNGKIFNLAIKGSGISTQYNLIRYFATHSDVKTIILGLDFFAFNPASTQNYKDINKTRYNNYFINDYKDALLSVRTFRKSIKTLSDNIKNKPAKLEYTIGWDSYRQDYIDLKNYGNVWLKERVNKSFPNFGIDKLFFDNEKFKNKYSIDEGLNILDSIVNICKIKNIDLKIFTTPIYHKVHEVIKQRGYQDTYNYWKQHLYEYDIVYDFSYKNSITNDYKNYIDSSHYQSKLGKLIFARLYDDNISELPNDFGIILKTKGDN